LGLVPQQIADAHCYIKPMRLMVSLLPAAQQAKLAPKPVGRTEPVRK
jgi:hypothetical protein